MIDQRFATAVSCCTLLLAAGSTRATEPVVPVPPCNRAFVSCRGPELPDAPDAGTRAYGGSAYGAERAGLKPFSAFAIAVNIGIGGFGFDLATPLNRRLTLRGGGSFFQGTANIATDGIQTQGTLHLRSGAINLDVFPFAGKFRISPGIAFYNGNRITAAASVPGGQNFDLGDATYQSSPTDPVHGSLDLNFGSKVAPRLTIGTGNMIPRRGGHFSVPFEFGVEYISAPTFALSLAGSACQGGVCQPVATDPETQANVRDEQNELNSDISPLRFFPIISVGVGYRF